MRFHYLDGDVSNVEWICNKDGLEGTDWLKIGCIRRDAGTPLTEWTAPAWKGERAPRTCMAMSVTRSPGQVKIRTKSGSDGYARPRQRDPHRAEKERLSSVEREFQGTLEEFRERLENQLGKQEESITEADGTLTWKQQGDTGARIEFKASNHRVYIIGKAHQI